MFVEVIESRIRQMDDDESRDCAPVLFPVCMPL